MKRYDSRQENFLKTRVENIGLSGDIVAALLNQNIRTIRSVIGYSRGELQKLLKLPQSEIDIIIDKTESTKPEDPFSLGAEFQSPPADMKSDSEGDNDIIKTLSNHLGKDKAEVISQSRQQDLVRVRDLITYLLRKYGDMSYPAIGRLLGGRDHTTIMHSYEKVSKGIQNHPELGTELIALIEKMNEIKERKLRTEKELIPAIMTSSWVTYKSGDRTRTPKEISERDIKMLGLWREGLTLANIGGIYRVSRERVRQVVVAVLKQTAFNESISKGIVMNSDVVVEEESKNRKKLKESKRSESHPKQSVQKRWSRYYAACRSCGTTVIPHFEKGFCEQCAGQFRDDRRREDVINRHGNKCDSCGRTRYEARALFGRDFYITKDEQVFCRGCFHKTNSLKFRRSKKEVSM